MIAGIVGLGLIGGSFAKAYHAAGHTVLAKELDKQVLSFARLSDDVDGELTKENIKECDIILICVYPQAVIDFLNEMGPFIGKHPVVIDCCGTKRVPMFEGEKIAEKYGFLYIGGHPMAGTQFSGFKYSKKEMFKGAPMVIVPPEYDDIVLLEKVKELLSPAGFRKITVTTAEKHDEMIAFTSQLAHIVSSAYIKSPTALAHRGFSAGSYRDMTRVAWLNPQMWAELFLDNSDYLIKEIGLLIDNLTDYKEAIEKRDREGLIKLLDEGRKRKEEVDG
ncbi:MAG: prephenate dehydrogenase [Lachnospiraceae bacterium]|nr:prephenate dehydrogenase [Lachnospiraceae bacterium]